MNCSYLVIIYCYFSFVMKFFFKFLAFLDSLYTLMTGPIELITYLSFLMLFLYSYFPFLNSFWLFLHFLILYLYLFLLFLCTEHSSIQQITYLIQQRSNYLVSKAFKALHQLTYLTFLMLILYSYFLFLNCFCLFLNFPYSLSLFVFTCILILMHSCILNGYQLLFKGTPGWDF